jgi:hypothetical protein
VRRSILSLGLLLATALVLTACGSNGEGSSDGLEIKLAPIHELDIRFAESFPIQVFLYVKGGLSDGYTEFHGLEITNRSESILKVKVTVERPKDAVCPALYTYFEQNVNLGTDFISGKMYTVTVNDKSTTFTMQ